jgi:hypothetical protein
MERFSYLCNSEELRKRFGGSVNTSSIQVSDKRQFVVAK